MHGVRNEDKFGKQRAIGARGVLGEVFFGGVFLTSGDVVWTLLDSSRIFSN